MGRVGDETGIAVFDDVGLLCRELHLAIFGSSGS